MVLVSDLKSGIITYNPWYTASLTCNSRSRWGGSKTVWLSPKYFVLEEFKYATEEDGFPPRPSSVVSFYDFEIYVDTRKGC